MPRPIMKNMLQSYCNHGKAGCPVEQTLTYYGFVHARCWGWVVKAFQPVNAGEKITAGDSRLKKYISVHMHMLVQYTEVELSCCCMSTVDVSIDRVVGSVRRHSVWRIDGTPAAAFVPSQQHSLDGTTCNRTKNCTTNFLSCAVACARRTHAHAHASRWRKKNAPSCHWR